MPRPVIRARIYRVDPEVCIYPKPRDGFFTVHCNYCGETDWITKSFAYPTITVCSKCLIQTQLCLIDLGIPVPHALGRDYTTVSEYDDNAWSIWTPNNALTAKDIAKL